MIKFTNLPDWAQEKILIYLETNNFPAAKELSECLSVTVKHVAQNINKESAKNEQHLKES